MRVTRETSMTLMRFRSRARLSSTPMVSLT
jgi:hypothetical protein